MSSNINFIFNISRLILPINSLFAPFGTFSVCEFVEISYQYTHETDTDQKIHYLLVVGIPVGVQLLVMMGP